MVTDLTRLMCEDLDNAVRVCFYIPSHHYHHTQRRHEVHKQHHHVRHDRVPNKSIPTFLNKEIKKKINLASLISEPISSRTSSLPHLLPPTAVLAQEPFARPCMHPRLVRELERTGHVLIHAWRKTSPGFTNETFGGTFRTSTTNSVENKGDYLSFQFGHANTASLPHRPPNLAHVQDSRRQRCMLLQNDNATVT
ncbi:unnamed protein product [Protopolystoma xenopodis]|uniref:Uncharacterized protein n=1 Tax=Protopolystoma xenopodis TaxID=117903 RepID=A0A3S5A9G7_9PLAT|nr:unnamed protein product [Protopolystoma xenopodis]